MSKVVVILLRYLFFNIEIIGEIELCFYILIVLFFIRGVMLFWFRVDFYEIVLFVVL